MARHYENRSSAGKALAQALSTRSISADGLVLALPRGGVPVAAEVSRSLGLPLDVLIVRKVGLPSNPELAMGAVASGGVIIRNDAVVKGWGVDDDTFNQVVQAQLLELDRREKLYRRGLAPLDVKNKMILLVDDGIATGSSIKAAIKALREREAKSIVVAVPAAAKDSVEELRNLADDVVSLTTPEQFFAVGSFYADFRQVEDEEVCRLLQH